MMALEDENGNKLRDEEIHDNVLTFLYAAYDSSSAALCWMIKVLTEKRDLLAQIQVRIHELNLVIYIVSLGHNICLMHTATTK